MSEKQPNILFIMSDDHAANAISAYGSRLAGIAPTPNIDRIGDEGVRLNNCLCTNSICTPSRAAILTGQYSHKNGVYTLADDLDRNREHVAHRLQRAGYETAMIGKWHLHTQPDGFDYYNVLPGQGLYRDPLFKETGKEWQDQNEGGEMIEGYCTDIIGDLTLDWLTTKRDRNKPFFLCCHHKAPHGLWEWDKRHKDYLEDVEIPEPDSLFEDKTHRCEATKNAGTGMYHLATSRYMSKRYQNGPFDITGMSKEEAVRYTYQRYLKDYLRCVKAIDENVGRLLDYLDEEGLAEETLVIYTSDQGMFLGEHDYFDKRWIYEESLTMPFMARYPKEIPSGNVNNEIVINTDFAPLFLDYAGAEVPAEMQGRSFRENLKGNVPTDWRTSMYYRYWMHAAHHNTPAHYGIVTDRYKLIFFYSLPLEMKGALDREMPVGWELYDLEKDPNELRNRYNDPAYRDVLAELKGELDKLKTELEDTDEKYPKLISVREKHWVALESL